MRCPTILRMQAILLDLSCEAKVGQHYMDLISRKIEVTDENVFWFQISVHDIHGTVQVLERRK